jgi:hypothetical protein
LRTTMPIAYARRKLRALEKRRKYEFARIDIALRHRLNQFLKGKLPWEQFLGETKEEHEVAKLDEKIMRIDDRKPKNRTWRARAEKKQKTRESRIRKHKKKSKS